MSNGLRLAIPSDGPLHEPTLLFLRASGLSVERPNSRQYTGNIPTIAGLVVHFQRGGDIPQKVEEGSADIGIVGQDHFLEMQRECGDATIIREGLGFGNSELVIGVPDSWVDVNSVADLADLSLEFRDQGKDIRIATKFPRLVERFLIRNGVKYFSLIKSGGTLEAAPAMGYADIIVDISSTGITLRENRLKPIQGGSILRSEACIIGNKSIIEPNTQKFDQASSFMELVHGHLQSRGHYIITANMKGENPDEVAIHVLRHTDIRGLTGPTISKIYSNDGKNWYAVTVIVESEKLLGAVNLFRQIGDSSVTVSQPNYIFHSNCVFPPSLTEK